jgi:TRAP-type C4-dicarboxylate transport system permease large subunit
VTSSSAIVGPIFPPSIPLIIYGTVTGVSVLQLLLGGILPGLLCVAGLMLMTAWLARRRGYPRAGRWPTLAELWRDALPAAAGAAGARDADRRHAGGLFHADRDRLRHRGLHDRDQRAVLSRVDWAALYEAALETIRASSAILLIVAVAALFGWILSVEQVPQALAGWMLSISTNPYVLLLLVNILLLIVGMFLDSTTAILVIAPIIAKPLVLAGVDPVHLGMVVVFNLMIGLLTPPMGLALYLVADIAQVSMKDVLREMLPFYIPLGLTLLLITYLPWITTGDPAPRARQLTARAHVTARRRAPAPSSGRDGGRSPRRGDRRRGRAAQRSSLRVRRRRRPSARAGHCRRSGCA